MACNNDQCKTENCKCDPCECTPTNRCGCCTVTEEE